MPSELNGAPALIVTSLVSVALEISPLSFLISSFFPDWEIDGVWPVQRQGSEFG